jgi:hypothetical protein
MDIKKEFKYKVQNKFPIDNVKSIRIGITDLLPCFVSKKDDFQYVILMPKKVNLLYKNKFVCELEKLNQHEFKIPKLEIPYTYDFNKYLLDFEFILDFEITEATFWLLYNFIPIHAGVVRPENDCFF